MILYEHSYHKIAFVFRRSTSSPQYHSTDLSNACLQKTVYMLACAQQLVSAVLVPNQTRSLPRAPWPFPKFSLKMRPSQFDVLLPCSQVSKKVDQTSTQLIFFLRRLSSTVQMSTICCAGQLFGQTAVTMTTSFLKLALAPDILPIINS